MKEYHKIQTVFLRTPESNFKTLMEAVELVKRGFKSTIAHNKDYDAEGLIMKPETELFNRQGNRIVAKIKFRDFIR